MWNVTLQPIVTGDLLVYTVKNALQVKLINIHAYIIYYNGWLCEIIQYLNKLILRT